MKKILSIILFLLLNFSFAQVKWMTIDEALKAPASESNLKAVKKKVNALMKKFPLYS